MSRYRIEITANGYLRISAETAEALFPSDALVAIFANGQLALLPTRGPGGGGMLLKQYNPRGDRAVLLTEVLPASGDGMLHEGVWHGSWDEEAHALRISLGVLS